MTINERVSDERIANLIEVLSFYSPEDKRLANNESELASALRELQQYRAAAEPVAWMVIDSDSGEKIIRVDRSDIEGAAIPLYAAPQVTSVPDEIESTSGSDYDDYYCDGWNACRAAMLAAPAVQAEQLSGNTEQVSQPVLPEHSPCIDAPDHIWLQTAGEWPASGEFSELTWSCDNQHPDDTLYVRADLVGNSPAIPDAIDANLVEALRLVQCMLEDYRERNHGDAERWIRHINDLMSDYSEAHGDDAYSVLHGLLPAAPKQDFREIPNSSTNNCRENADSSTKCWCHTCRPVTMTDMRFVVCPECGNKRCPHANDHRNACTGSNEPGQEGSAYPAAPQQEAE